MCELIDIVNNSLINQKCFAINNCQSILDEDEKYAVVFDLDNTLIYSTRIPTKDTSFMIQFGEKKTKMYIQVRPGLVTFLETIKNLYDIYFFTSSNSEYAYQIIRRIAPYVPPSHCFYKEHCILKNGYELKDLRMINKPIRNVILVDDIQGSGLMQPLNSIIIPPFYGDTEDNMLLDELLPLLKKCSKKPELLLNIRKFAPPISPHLLLFYQ